MPALAVVPYFTVHDGVLRRDFADCVTLRVTETLQSVDELHVTSPSSTMNLDRRLTEAEIGRKLGVDYVLRGQIMRNDQTLYFTQWLYDVASDELILEVEIECGLGQLESFERDILARVIADVRLPLQENEIDRIMGKRPRNASAYELVIRAQLAMHRMDRRGFAAAKQLLERARALDPNYATAYAWLARYHSIRIGQGWTKDRNAETEEARRLADIAIALDPDNAVALATAGHVRSFLDRDFEEGERLLRRATKACANEPLGWLLLSATLSYTGRAREGREHAEYAMSLSPLDSCLYAFHTFSAVSCYLSHDYTAAVAHGLEAAQLNPSYATIYRILAVAHVGRGDVHEARTAAAMLRRLDPAYTYEVAERTLPFRDPVERELALVRLRTAGCFDQAEPLPPH